MPAGALALEQLELDDDPPEQTATDRVLQTLSAVGADERAVVKIHQVQPSGKESWCDDIAPHDFEQGGLRLLRDKWGPGVYSIRLYGTREGHFGILTRTQVTISPVREPVASSAGAAQVGPLADVLRMIAEGQQAMLRALTERPAPVDPHKQMLETFTVMKAMRDAMGESDRAPPRNAIKDAVEAIQLLREAQDIVAPAAKAEESSDDSLTGILRTMAPMISGAIAARSGGGQPQLAPDQHLENPAGDALPLPPSPADLTPAPTTEPGEAPMSAELLAAIKLRAFMLQLLTWASADGAEGTAHVEQGAELVADKLPDELVDVLELPSWFEMLAVQAPQVAPHRAWLTKVRDQALALLYADHPDDAIPPA